jgi:hypothetical protein
MHLMCLGKHRGSKILPQLKKGRAVASGLIKNTPLYIIPTVYEDAELFLLVPFIYHSTQSEFWSKI